jgi:triosephosphate isomerase
VVEHLRGLLRAHPGGTAVLYGGSVSPESVEELMRAPIDGVFVGRAATTPAGFVEIARRMARTRADIRRPETPTPR